MATTRYRRLAVAAVAALALTVPAANAQAGLIGGLLNGLVGGIDCGDTSAVFRQFGDWSHYYRTDNGGFESGSRGWSLAGGAQVVGENESYHLGGFGERSSMLLPDGASVVSGQQCFGLLNPGVRMVAKSPSGSAVLHVRVIARGLLGGLLGSFDGGSVQVGPSWQPTPVFDTLVAQLNALLLGAKSIQLVFVAEGGPVQIDDVYIDPFLHR